MILYEPVRIGIKDYKLHRKLFSKYIRIIQEDKDFFKVLQIKTDEYVREVQRRYERRYNIKSILFRKLKRWFE